MASDKICIIYFQSDDGEIVPWGVCRDLTEAEFHLNALKRWHDEAESPERRLQVLDAVAEAGIPRFRSQIRRAIQWSPSKWPDVGILELDVSLGIDWPTKSLIIPRHRDDEI